MPNPQLTLIIKPGRPPFQLGIGYGEAGGKGDGGKRRRGIVFLVPKLHLGTFFEPKLCLGLTFPGDELLSI
jgi:hypothetical protein